MKKYDVIIAGAGLAGLKIAYELSGSGISVLILDKKKRATDIAYYSSGTFMKPDDFNIPKQFFHPITELKFESKNESCLKKISDCSVLDRKIFYNWMENKILQDKDIHIRYNCEITETKFRFGRLDYIGYSDNGRFVNGCADIYVDCSGIASVFGRKAGITNKRCIMALGVEHIVPTKDNFNRAYLFVGGNLGGGYGWVFPKSGNESITGVGVIIPKRFSEIDKIYEEMWKKRYISAMCKHRSLKKNIASLITGNPLGHFVSGNIMAVGDCALQANPLIGEGIRFILDAACEASFYIKKAITSKNIRFINDYGKEWKKKYLKIYKFSYFMQRVLCKVSLKDWILDKGVKVLRCCNEYQFKRVISADISLSFMIYIIIEAWFKIKVWKTHK